MGFSDNYVGYASEIKGLGHWFGFMQGSDFDLTSERDADLVVATTRNLPQSNHIERFPLKRFGWFNHADAFCYLVKFKEKWTTP